MFYGFRLSGINFRFQVSPPKGLKGNKSSDLEHHSYHPSFQSTYQKIFHPETDVQVMRIGVDWQCHWEKMNFWFASEANKLVRIICNCFGPYFRKLVNGVYYHLFRNFLCSDTQNLDYIRKFSYTEFGVHSNVTQNGFFNCLISQWFRFSFDTEPDPKFFC